MKFIKSLLICVIILNVILSYVEANAKSEMLNKDKRNNRLSTDKKKLKSKSSRSEQLQFISGRFNDLFSAMQYNRDFFDFSFGVFREVYLAYEFDDIFKKKKNIDRVYPEFKECFSNTFVSKIKSEVPVQIDENWNKFIEGDRQKFCVNVKKEVDDKYKKKNSWKSFISSLISKYDSCDVEDKEIDNMVILRYKIECTYFRDKKCSDLNDSIYEYVPSFMSKSLSYVDSLEGVLKCMEKTPFILKEQMFDLFRFKFGKSFIENVKNDSYEYNSKNELEEWGGIKGAYYVLKLGDYIEEFNKEFKVLSNPKKYHDSYKVIYYELGQLVGKAMTTAHLVKQKNLLENNSLK